MNDHLSYFVLTVMAIIYIYLPIANNTQVQFCCPSLPPAVLFVPPQWGAADAEIKVPSVRTQSLKLNVLPLKPGVGQYIAIHATLTARDFFLTYFYPSGPFICIFSQTTPFFFPVLAVADTCSYVGLQKKIGHPAG